MCRKRGDRGWSAAGASSQCGCWLGAMEQCREEDLEGLPNFRLLEGGEATEA